MTAAAPEETHDAQVTWQKPGPGTWRLDASHTGPAPGPIIRHLMRDSIEHGLAEGMALFGTPLKGMDVRFVNGKFYRRLVPLVGGDKDMRPPPAPVLWLATRLHPEFRRQERRAKESFETKRWRAELDRWNNEWKPGLIARNLQLTDVDPSALDDAALAAHVEEVHEHVLAGARLHHRLHVSDMGPLGNLMVHLDSWGIPPTETFRALVAASPETRAPARALRALADEMTAAGTDPATMTSLADVRAVSPRAAQLLDEYLRHHGWRLTTGYDIEDRCLAELPDVVLMSIRAAAQYSEEDAEERSRAALAGLRAEIPPEHRDQFDELVQDARESYGLRDENGPLTYEWPAGLLRRAVVEAGARLERTERLTAAAEIFELDIAEIFDMLRGGVAPGREEIARRGAERRRWAALEPPVRLGPEEPDPPVHVFPPNLARITRIVLTVVSTLEGAEGRESLSGTGVGEGTYRAVARVVHDPTEALNKLEPGDVLVAPFTAPTYNSVLAIAGGLVVEEGGLLCHAAVIAREFGIPAVVGARNAMDLIPDGAMVEIDPAAGRVTVVN